MISIQDRKTVLGLGGGLALLLGLGLAVTIMSRDKRSDAPPPASRGGLVVETGAGDEGLDPARPLRCFVGGQFVGMETLAECARRNGVAAAALDVGVDETGALAAANDPGLVLQPLTPAQAAAAPVQPPPAAPPAAAPAPLPSSGRPVLVCLRHQNNEWRDAGVMTLNACVQALFAGRCERPGAASYGRWGEETLRLVPGRVEISADNRTFRTLIDQGAGCSIPQIGG